MIVGLQSKRLFFIFFKFHRSKLKMKLFFKSRNLKQKLNINARMFKRIFVKLIFLFFPIEFISVILDYLYTHHYKMLQIYFNINQSVWSYEHFFFYQETIYCQFISVNLITLD